VVRNKNYKQFYKMKDKILIAFGKRVRELRKERNWSQEKLAEISGLHPNYIGMIERGERNPSLLNIVKIASAYNLNLSELLNQNQ
jgi:transcriptional regulator with XRE-family HTH domain